MLQQYLLNRVSYRLWPCGPQSSPRAIRVDALPVTGLASRKAESLLVYLACNNRPLPGELLAELLTLAQPPIVVAAAWSPDGRYLATSGLGPPTSVWRVWQSKQELIDYARECCIFRALTAEERVTVGLQAQELLRQHLCSRPIR